MKDRDYLLRRIGFLEGVIATIELYAIWKDGERFIGVIRTPMKDAICPYEEELTAHRATLEGIGK